MVCCAASRAQDTSASGLDLGCDSAQARLSVAAGAPKAAAEALGALLAQTQRASPAANDPRRQALTEIESQVCGV